MADVFFSNTEEVISQPWIELHCMSTTFGLMIEFAMSFWRSYTNNWETGSSIEPQRPPSLKIAMTSYLRRGWSELDENWYSDAEWHADYCDMVEITTGRKIPIWLFSKTGSSYISAVNWDISTIFDLQTDFGFWKSVTSLDTEPEVVLCRRGFHLENR